MTASCAGAAPDILAIFQPGDVTDVVSAGLELPGAFRSSPDLRAPLSLLELPSSLGVSYFSSHPFRQDGADRWRVRSSSAEALVTLRDRGRAGEFAAGLSADASSLHLSESGGALVNGHLSPKTHLAGVCLARGDFAAGLSIGRESHSGLVESTRLEGIAPTPGDETGYLAWTESHPSLSAEARARLGRHEMGLSYRQAYGGITATTVSDGQSYRVRQQFSGTSWSPYWAWNRRGFTALATVSWSSGRSLGPVSVGNLVAGSMTGNTDGSSVSLALRSRGHGSTQMWSLEHARQSADLYGSAGGFLFPGILSRSYATRDFLAYERYALRWGHEKRNGSTALRAGVMLSYGSVDLRLLATRARFLRPPVVLAREELDNAGLWVLAPGFGVGYASGDWRVDAGASIVLAILQESIESSGPSGDGGGDSGTVRPSYRWGVTVRKLL